MRDPLTDRGDVTGGSTDATERSSACSTGASQSSPRPIRFAVRRATPLPGQLPADDPRPERVGRPLVRGLRCDQRRHGQRQRPGSGLHRRLHSRRPPLSRLAPASTPVRPSTLYPPRERSSTSTCAASQMGHIRPGRSGSPTASTRVKRPRSPRYSGRRHLTRPRSTSRPRRSTPEGRLGMVSPRRPTREIHGGGEPSPMGATVALPPRRTP
jgi:hypothetical protein